jgi:hypothetical protein
VLQGVLHCLLRDLGEHHALDRNLRLEFLQQMPGDGLALAVGVGGQVELVGLLEFLLELLDRVALVGADHVQRGKVMVDVDAGACPGFALELGRHLGRRGGQITHMAAAGVHEEVLAQVALDLGHLVG